MTTFQLSDLPDIKPPKALFNCSAKDDSAIKYFYKRTPKINSVTKQAIIYPSHFDYYEALLAEKAPTPVKTPKEKKSKPKPTVKTKSKKPEKKQKKEKKVDKSKKKKLNSNFL